MAEPRTLMTEIALGESPRWHAGKLWFSDWGAGEILAFDESGNREVILRDLGRPPFCFDWLPDGRLLVVLGREARLMRQEPDGTMAIHADLSGLSTHPWNEIVVDGRGNAYVNNTGFDFPTAEFAPGTIALVKPDGAVRQVADGVAFPNGMAITPDNATLIVAESYAGQLNAFDIDVNGSLSNRRVWAAVDDSAPDGICLDAEGAVWFADVPNRRCARVREGGEVLQTISLDRSGFACMLGGVGRRTLFILAADWSGPASLAGGERTGRLLGVDVDAPGSGFP